MWRKLNRKVSVLLGMSCRAEKCMAVLLIQSRCEIVEDKPFPPQACRQKFFPKIASVGFNFFLVNSCLGTVFKIDKIVAGMNLITAVSCCHDNLHV